MESKRKIIIAVTGASGAIYAETLLEGIAALENRPGQAALIFTANAEEIWNYELGTEVSWLKGRDNSSTAAGSHLFKIYENDDFYAPFASGSSKYDTMIICPASMGMMGRIAAGTADDLISRAADVMLKERRKLILVPRETPYNLIHINNMKRLTEAGAIILPATPSFYSRPQSIKELVSTVTDRILRLAGFDPGTPGWGE